MPAYFSITLQFDKKRLKPNFVKNLYSSIISSGFAFKSGFWFHEEATLDDIINWNQNLLEQGFELGDTQHVKHDYMQILFHSELYSEFRGFWMYSEQEISFDLIIPEADLLDYQNEHCFIKEKQLMPVKNLCLDIWKSVEVDSIQTSLEGGGACSLNDIRSGNDVSIYPFAILKEEDYNHFPEDYFNKEIILKIKNEGVFIENEMQ